MRSSLPKVLHSAAGQPLLFHILDKIKETAPESKIALVVGHGREQVEQQIREHVPFSGLDITFIIQAEQRGTGHAARCAMDSLWGQRVVKSKSPVLVLAGDTPLITADLIAEMLVPLPKSSPLRVLTTDLEDASGYGRIIRKGRSTGKSPGKLGPVLKIVEDKDATPSEKAVREINSGMYTFDSKFLSEGLHKLSDKNAQGELYLTDLISQAARLKKPAIALKWKASDDLRGINDLWELACADRTLNERVVKNWAKQGVRFIDPWTTRVEVSVELSEGVTIHPGVNLLGSTKIHKSVTIGPHVVLRDVEVHEGAHIKTGTFAEQSIIGPEAQVGPYAHFRPESVVGRKSKIGNFVELKKTRVGDETSIAHLSYLGDAQVGSHVNIGCGFVTCNFDGRVINGSRKHKTIIEDEAFIGSDCQTIAPVTIGKGAYIGSGSTITDDVEAGALAIARSRQVTKPGYVKKLKGA